jgi:NarL family two-component system response regulator LiaR
MITSNRQVYRGEPPLHPIIARKVLQELTHPSEAPPKPDMLTPREVEVLKLVAKGMKNTESAVHLGVCHTFCILDRRE